MLLGLDHVIIAVRELDRASDQMERALGLRFAPGGEQPELGTASAIARFGTDYLELISVRKPEVARDSERGRLLLDLLGRQDAQLVGFAIISDDLERDTVEARGRGLPLEGPFHGSRRRPDGSLLTWRLATVPNDPWGHRLPFLIQHTPGMLQRRSWEPLENHQLRVHALHSVAVAVGDLDAAVEGYRRLLGEPPDTVDDVQQLPARRALFCIGSFHIELLQPTDSTGPLADLLRLRGDGLFLLGLGVPNLEGAVRLLRGLGTAVGDPTPWGVAPLLDPLQTLGVAFQLVEVPLAHR